MVLTKQEQKRLGLLPDDSCSDLERRFRYHLIQHGIRMPRQNFRFHSERLWEFDFAWVREKVAVDVDGEKYHANPEQLIKDHWKRNAALMMGWKVLVFTGSMVRLRPAVCIEQVRQLLAGREIDPC